MLAAALNCYFLAVGGKLTSTRLNTKAPEAFAFNLDVLREVFFDSNVSKYILCLFYC